MSRTVYRHSRITGVASSAFIAASGLLAPPAAIAQQGAAAADSAALGQRTRGLQAMRAGNFAEAIAAFERSLSIVESPNTRLDLGRAHLAAGHLASALRELERARDTGRARVDAGQAQYTQTVRTAAAEADGLRPRVPLVAMRFSQTPPANTEVFVGDTRIPAAAISEPVPVDPGEVRFRLAGPAVRTHSVTIRVNERERPSIELPVHVVGYLRVTVEPAVRDLRVEFDTETLDPHEVGRDHEVVPGTHRVRVTAPGFAAAEQTREIAVGERAVLEVTLRRVGESAHSDVRSSTLPTPTPATANGGTGPSMTTMSAGRRNGPLPIVGIVTLSVGVAAIGTGLALWFVSDGAYGTLLRECPAGPCTSAMQIQRASEAQTFETIGIVSMIGGGVAVGAGLALFLAGTLTRERSPTTLVVGPASLHVSTRF